MRATLLVALLLGSPLALADGKQILESQCIECHTLNGAGGSKQAAPPMYAVWHHYRQAFPEKEAFVAALSEWLLAPKQDKAELMGAIKKFGMMEKIEISKADAMSVAEHLYARSFALPEWYLSHYKNKHGNQAHGYEDKHAQRHEIQE